VQKGIVWTLNSEPIKGAFVRESLLQRRANGKVVCGTCERKCQVVPGGFGWCRTRQNRDGKLVTLIYGAVSSISANPIEKKPFYHFYPGTRALTAGGWSCNFGCPWCQNWDISKAAPPALRACPKRNVWVSLSAASPAVLMRDERSRRRFDAKFYTSTPSRLSGVGTALSVTDLLDSLGGEVIMPEQFIKLVESNDCQGTSISFNEPTLSLEWSLDVFRLARDRGLYNTYVTNGYMTPEALSLLIDAGLDAMNVDVKGDAPAVKRFCKGIDVEKVWQTCRRARSRGVHVEVTTLLIPTVNDAETTLQGIAERIVSELGCDVPWHITAYYPSYRFTAPPTPRKALERAWHIGKDAGLPFVYVGNVPGHKYDNTYCPGCGELLIKRSGFDVLLNSLQEGRCPKCGDRIAGVWEWLDSPAPAKRR
jgi:pyruvate formate lyase activating enzyme